ncbi:MAG: hypothetical protein AB1503_06790 [Bacillota bacterium]
MPRWLDNWMIYEITPQERDQLIEKLARLVRRFGMYTPAIFMLETGKDLSWLGSQFMHLFSPVITLVWGDFEKLAFLLEDKQNVERLIRRIEELSEEEKRQARERRAAARPGRPAPKDNRPPGDDRPAAREDNRAGERRDKSRAR